jgi:hypothetical protein
VTEEKGDKEVLSAPETEPVTFPRSISYLTKELTRNIILSVAVQFPGNLTITANKISGSQK